MESEIRTLIKLDCSDAYIEAVIYGRYKYKYNMERINYAIQIERKKNDGKTV